MFKYPDQWSKQLNIQSFNLVTYNLPIKYNSYLVGIVCRESGNSNTEYGQCLYSYTLSTINIMGRNGHSHLLVIGI